MNQQPITTRQMAGVVAAPFLLAGCGASEGYFDVTSPALLQKTTAVNCSPSDTVCQDGLNRGYLCGEDKIATEVAAPPWQDTRRVDNGQRLSRASYQNFIFVQCVERGKDKA